jgi:hypothetical protein
MLGCGPASSTTSSTDASASSSTSSTSSDSTGTDDTQSTNTETGADPCPPSSCLDFLPSDECDPFAQDCPAGEKCVPLADGRWYYSKCFAVAGDAAAGEPCNDISPPAADDCDAMSVCVSGFCQPLCMGDEQMPICPQGYGCASPPICVQLCHPFAEPCAAPELACKWTGELFGCLGAGDPSPPGEQCSGGCAFGICVSWNEWVNCGYDSGCCTEFCELSAGDGPCQVLDPDRVCAPYFEGYDDIGLCITGP